MLSKLLLQLTTICLYIINALSIELPTDCGKSRAAAITDINGQIVGGGDAAPGEFPWQAIIAMTGETEPDTRDSCGGTIIADQWILTAAHCVVFYRHPESVYVRLGVHNRLATDPATEVMVNVSKIISHKDFNVGNITNDLALVKLSQRLDFSGKHKHLAPICLATHSNKTVRNCMATGFGSVDTEGQRPQNLQKLRQPIVAALNCYKAYSMYRDDLELCAGGAVGGGASACDADAGGPLQCISGDDQQRWYQLGVQSYGPDPCAKPHEPDVYGRVSEFVDWIKQQQ